MVESALYKGNSSSIKLYNLVVRMKLVEIKYGIQLSVTHVSGKRMQAQGTDGVSRGSLKSGVAAGKEMIEYCPWGKDPIMKEPNLKLWIKSWAGEETIFLSPKDWYLRGHDLHGGDYNEKKFWIPKVKKGTYVWSPPAAAAGPCLEELRKARMKRQQSRHIVIIHRLMTPTWLKQINKAADCIFVIPACHPFWPATNFEPLYVAILFPYLDYRPFQLKGTPKMYEMGRKLSKVFQEVEVDGRNILRKFLLDIGNLPSMSPRMVWRLLYLGGHTPFPHSIPTDSGQRFRGSSKRTQDCSIGKVETKRIKPSRF